MAFHFVVKEPVPGSFDMAVTCLFALLLSLPARRDKAAARPVTTGETRNRQDESNMTAAEDTWTKGS
ncbi:hypothetical protein M440DRAFT_1405460 [Trichoderma longibrachiatum ATCC 18648]|uniref:Uncharacterized protein n=1 Tax=Trichoderma longibrachiatum ATCC 18648 TaxID=983965 RepID=A0A2T4BT29_TRILO|nr:hypothetical protein M440DRAFT_1405460 [Trichoderma longibrachiatum ATCC 18648]